MLLVVLFRLFVEGLVIVDDDAVAIDVGSTEDEDNVDEDKYETGCDSFVINWEEDGICSCGCCDGGGGGDGGGGERFAFVCALVITKLLKFMI